MQLTALAALAAVALAASCGSSKPSAEAVSPTALPTKRESQPSSTFCTRYSRIYCVHEVDEEAGVIRETLFDEFSAEEQASLLSTCEEVYAAFTEEERKVASRCLSCTVDCGHTQDCLEGMGDSCPSFEEDPSEDPFAPSPSEE